MKINNNSSTDPPSSAVWEDKRIVRWPNLPHCPSHLKSLAYISLCLVLLETYSWGKYQHSDTKMLKKWNFEILLFNDELISITDINHLYPATERANILYLPELKFTGKHYLFILWTILCEITKIRCIIYAQHSSKYIK